MEKIRKSGRARIVTAGAIALVVGALASLGATGYAARLVKFSNTSPQAAQYPAGKVTICHHTHSQKNPTVTITVSVNALPAHLNHGDTVGPCPPESPATPALPGKPQKAHKPRKARKAHTAKHSVNKSQLRRHGKPAKTKTSSGDQSQSSAATVHGKGQAQGKGHDKPTKTHGQGQGHGQGGTGHGQGHGQGQGATHGSNSGGGKGIGRKP